jgi:hypothetical protein
MGTRLALTSFKFNHPETALIPALMRTTVSASKGIASVRMDGLVMIAAFLIML